MRKIILIILPFAFCLLPFATCSVPNLESGECQQARDPVKRFYSYHFGNDMKNSPENVKKLSEFLSADLQKQLENQPETATDYFTQTDDYPKAFRAGGCETIAPDRAGFGILLFWKDDTRSEQRKINVEVVKENEKWLVDKVSKAAE